MDRKEFFEKAVKFGFCSSALLALNFDTIQASWSKDELSSLKSENEFILNWLSDLLDSMDKVLDKKTIVKIIEGCGKGCFNRHQFKKDIAEKGKGNLDNLIEAYKNNFEIWREDDLIHIRYGEKSSQCYCPAAKARPPQENDLQCECTRMTHQTIFETALERSFKVDILESLRRGGVTCHFVVHLS